MPLRQLLNLLQPVATLEVMGFKKRFKSLVYSPVFAGI
jgi:hypothetical protein